MLKLQKNTILEHLFATASLAAKSEIKMIF